MFRGRYQHTIDPKGRLSVPAKFRDALAQYDGALMVVPNEHCLEVHPLEEWQRIEARLREQSIFSAEVQELGRLYISRAKDVTLDAAGRDADPARTRASRPGSPRRRSRSWAGGCRDSRCGTAAGSTSTSGRGRTRLPTLFERLSGQGV